MSTTIPGLLGSATFELSVTVHARHHDTGGGVCAACARPVPCPARRAAATVITLAGDDPCSYRTPPADQPQPPVTPLAPVSGPPAYGGFAVAGRRRPLPAMGFRYERESD